MALHEHQTCNRCSCSDPWKSAGDGQCVCSVLHVILNFCVEIVTRHGHLFLADIVGLLPPSQLGMSFSRVEVFSVEQQWFWHRKMHVVSIVM